MVKLVTGIPGLEVYSGSVNVSLDVGASQDITIEIPARVVLGVPKISIDNSAITVSLKNGGYNGFVVSATNTDTANAQSGNLTYEVLVIRRF